jgi:hypothetical protein
MALCLGLLSNTVSAVDEVDCRAGQPCLNSGVNTDVATATNDSAIPAEPASGGVYAAVRLPREVAVEAVGWLWLLGILLAVRARKPQQQVSLPTTAPEHGE